MKNKLSWLVGGMLMSCALSAQANVIVTPFIGFTGGGQVEDENKNTYDIDPALSYALSIETPFEMGKIGLFYSAQPTELKELSNPPISIIYNSKAVFTIPSLKVGKAM